MNVDPQEMTARLVLALQIAREAGKITLEYFRREDLEVAEGRRFAGDRGRPPGGASSQPHRRGICPRRRCGRGTGHRPGNDPFRWIIDPIDGTKAFIHGVPLYGTLIGIEHEGEPVAGVIHVPALDECVYASRAMAPGTCRDRNRSGRHGFPAGPALAGLFLTSEVATYDESAAATSMTAWKRPPG